MLAEVMPDKKREEVMKLQDEDENVAISIAVMGFLHPAIAEMAMAFSSINVVTNSNRLKGIDISPSYQS